MYRKCNAKCDSMYILYEYILIDMNAYTYIHAQCTSTNTMYRDVKDFSSAIHRWKNVISPHRLGIFKVFLCNFANLVCVPSAFSCLSGSFMKLQCCAQSWRAVRRCWHQLQSMASLHFTEHAAYTYLRYSKITYIIWKVYSNSTSLHKFSRVQQDQWTSIEASRLSFEDQKIKSIWSALIWQKKTN
jgi:hypothetical protein